MLHGRTGVNLDEPHVVLSINHKIVAEHLMCILSVHHGIPCCEHTRYNTLLDLWLYLRLIHVFPLRCLLQVFLELITSPHVAFDGALPEVLGLTRDAVIGKMHELVVDLRWIVVVGCKPQVALIEVPDLKRGPGSYHHPLTDVELLREDYQRVLDVLLDHPDCIELRSLYGLDYIFKFGMYCDASASRFSSWFQDPCILSPNY